MLYVSVISYMEADRVEADMYKYGIWVISDFI